MVDAVVSRLLDQLISVAQEELKEQVRLVVGVENEVKNLTSNLETIQAVLKDAEQRQVKQETVRLWLDRLKDTAYDMEDVLEEWITARLKFQIEGVDENALVPKKVCSFFSAPCFGFKQVFLRRDIAIKIQEINENLDGIVKQKDMFNFNVNLSNSNETTERITTTSLIDESEIIGRGSEKHTLISKLVSESSSEGKGLHIISLVGMGGIGKTTLAQLAYNDHEVQRNFDHKIWVCVSDSYDEIRIARAIIEVLEGSNCNLVEFQSLMKHIQDIIAGKKFLLILDDVWNEDNEKWEPFYHCLKNGSHGSKILITTRKETVAHMMRSTDIVNINELTEDECWSLFKRLAFFGRSIEQCEKLEQIGLQIVRKCKGLPLATKAIGSLLCSKNTEEEWQYILDSEMWEQEELEKGLFAPLLLSYNDLPPMVKRCFSYCAIFPKDSVIFKDELIKLWMAQGYLSAKKNKEMEIIGEEYFRILATRSFFQEFAKNEDDNIENCKMHDIVHDFAQFLSTGESFTTEVLNSLEESLINMKVCHSLLPLGGRVPFNDFICKFQRMRSLLIRGDNVDYSSISRVLEELFGKLTRLRALDLSGYDLSSEEKLMEIPRNINKLVHLKYINLSNHKMESLPETFCELYNLQILNIGWCKNLKELPQGIGNLVNLRHLLNHCTLSLHCMPAGIARLTNLRTLTKFVHNSRGCTFESLKNLNLLRQCCLESLGNVSDMGEAPKSELEKKKNLQVLDLDFFVGEGEKRIREDEQLLEALQPPINLKKLQIWSYHGYSVFPSWMLSLTNMRILHLDSFENCKHLPPLGILPSLEKLFILRMTSVTKVGCEFLGTESNNDSSSSSSIISFPKLKLLNIWWMDKLEEWDYGIATNREIMPRLSSLDIFECSKLKGLPDHLLRTTTLQSLQIRYCRILEERYEARTDEDWPNITHIPNVNIQ